MSTIKSPDDKKKISLDRDRRNVYGENAKSSRKNIPKSKRLSHKSERGAANRPLRAVVGNVLEESSIAAELESRDSQIEKHRQGFTKVPDEPLGVVLKRKAVRSPVPHP